MLVFCTNIPLKNSVSKKDFIDLCSTWVYNSPHYHNMLIEYDVNNPEDYENQIENITCKITSYKDDIIDALCFRLKNYDNDNLWIIDILYIVQGENRFISVQNNWQLQNFNSNQPKVNKPNFIKTLVQSNYGWAGDFFKVTDTPIVCNSDNASSLANYIIENKIPFLPMVYVSYPHIVNCEYLSKLLSGIAYVVKEDNRDTSFALKEHTDSKNVHSGFIGLYYPGSEKYQIFSEWDLGPFNKEKHLANIVQQSHLNYISSTEYNWNQIQSLKAKLKAANSEQHNKQTLEEYISLADEIYKDNKEKIERLQRENDSLTAQLEMLKAKNSEGIYISTELQDLCIDEQKDFVLNVLKQVQEKNPRPDGKPYRRYDILDSILSNNKVSGDNERIINGVKEIMKPGMTWNTTKGRLKSLGFTVDESKHKKIIYKEDKYSFTLASTPSDFRGTKNLFSEIENTISIGKKII